MSKRPKLRKSNLRRIRENKARRWLETAWRNLETDDFEGAAEAALLVLDRVSARGELAVDAMEIFGISCLMLRDYEMAYQALSGVLIGRPDEPDHWYNRALAGRFTCRFGQSCVDLRRAVELADGHPMRATFAKELVTSEEMVQRELDLRGPGFTIQQLIEVEENFRRGFELLALGEFVEAEECFRQVNQKDTDCLPQPWGNLGVCLLMQRRYEEAEDALRRALEIDPNYQFARDHLDSLPQLRLQNEIPIVLPVGPFDGVDLKPSFY